ncbi:hypothetical protein VTN77DRAFT_7812 [Rasamsonia byssochlamydoides]|uniref:uncharacterized protein n=1 Tax=Rasamsonia byssochlamydoides TaxID=89139 RepID=UPI003743A711
MKKGLVVENQCVPELEATPHLVPQAPSGGSGPIGHRFAAAFEQHAYHSKGRCDAIKLIMLVINHCMMLQWGPLNCLGCCQWTVSRENKATSQPFRHCSCRRDRNLVLQSEGANCLFCTVQLLATLSALDFAIPPKTCYGASRVMMLSCRPMGKQSCLRIITCTVHRPGTILITDGIRARDTNICPIGALPKELM